MKKFALGVDIGGTNTAFGIVDMEGNIVKEDHQRTPSFKTAQDLAEFLFNFASEEFTSGQLLGIGIGAPNGNLLTGSIDHAPNLHWKGVVPLKEIFEAKFKLPCFVNNDANAAAIGEKIFGNARDLSDFVQITLGTGLGSGIFIANKLIVGKHGLAGEYGHIRVVHNGRVCGCGRKGCLETYASATGVVRSISELQSDNKKLSQLTWLENPSAIDVFRLGQEGDLFAQEIIDFTAEILGTALADFTAFSDPQAFILFGGLSQSGAYFSDLVDAHFQGHLLNIYQGSVEIRNTTLNERNAAVLGASANVFLELHTTKS